MNFDKRLKVQRVNMSLTYDKDIVRISGETMFDSHAFPFIIKGNKKEGYYLEGPPDGLITDTQYYKLDDAIRDAILACQKQCYEKWTQIDKEKEGTNAKAKPSPRKTIAKR